MFVKFLDVKGSIVFVDPYSVTHIMECKPLTLPCDNGPVLTAPYTIIGLKSGCYVFVKESCEEVEKRIDKELD